MYGIIHIHKSYMYINLYIYIQPKVLFVLGGPGVGKGTMCKSIVQDFDFKHISAGDVLRNELRKSMYLYLFPIYIYTYTIYININIWLYIETEQAQLIRQIIDEGKIVPVEITVNLLKEAMNESIKNGNNTFLIDGFPRNQDNLTGWNNIMSSSVELIGTLSLVCDEDTMIERLLQRATDANANEKRSDDNRQTIAKRLKTFEQSTKPILEHLKKTSRVYTIDANLAPNLVYKQIFDLFTTTLASRLQ